MVVYLMKRFLQNIYRAISVDGISTTSYDGCLLANVVLTTTFCASNWKRYIEKSVIACNWCKFKRTSASYHWRYFTLLRPPVNIIDFLLAETRFFTHKTIIVYHRLIFQNSLQPRLQKICHRHKHKVTNVLHTSLWLYCYRNDSAKYSAKLVSVCIKWDSSSTIRLRCILNTQYQQMLVGLRLGCRSVYTFASLPN